MNISLSRAKSAAENGQFDCRELRDSVIQAIRDAGGKIDYAEVHTPASFSESINLNYNLYSIAAALFTHNLDCLIEFYTLYLSI